MHHRLPSVSSAMSIRTPLDSLLDRITILRLTLYALLGLVLWALTLSVLGVLHYAPVDIAAAALLATSVALVVNTAFARLLRAVSDPQSTIITALILVLIVPPGFQAHAVFLATASAIAIASKYVVTVDKQHLFNPAALAVAALPLLFPEMTAEWWVGTAAMLPAVLLCGGLVMIRTRKTDVVITFLAAYLLVFSGAELFATRSLTVLGDALRMVVVDSALLFFVFIMMTDPITVPSPRLVRFAYVSFVALLYATPELRFLRLGLTPEQVLCIGNAVSFAVRPKYRLTLRLKRKYKAGTDTWVFHYGLPEQRFTFAPGQFMEWAVPHANPDGRGQRRLFTIASSPTEGEITLVMRIPQRPSSYKRALAVHEEGSPVIASRLAGDFVLPRDLNEPLVFICGGVGIAPFRSMAQYLVDKGIRCNIVLLYACRRVDEILFADTFQKASQLGLRTVYLLTDRDAVPAGWTGRVGRITGDVIKAESPDFLQRTFFVAGSQRMVRDMETTLRGIGVHQRQIRSDYFDGSVDA